jgi:hypothetical protein
MNKKSLSLFHFSLGDSSDGPIGFCANIEAESPEKALEILRERLPGASEISGDGQEYITVYFNGDAVTVDDIDDETDADDDDDGSDENRVTESGDGAGDGGYIIANDSGTESFEIHADSPEGAALQALNRLGWYVQDDEADAG